MLVCQQPVLTPTLTPTLIPTLTATRYAVCVAYVFVHPLGEKMTSNGRVFESGTIIKAGEQLPTQQILHFCQPIVKKVKGWRETPIFARSEWWQKQSHPVTPQP